MRVLVTGSSDYENTPHAVNKIHMRLNLILALADSFEEKLTVVYGNGERGVDGIVDRWIIRRQGDVHPEPLPTGGWQHGRMVQTACLLGPVDFWFAFGGEEPMKTLKVMGAVYPRHIR